MEFKNIISLILLIFLVGCYDSKSPVEKEIEAIENGLTKAFVRFTESVEKYSIKDRMEYYKIPGLSIAVVIDGKLRWAKGYGIANEITRSSVDENTLFQAASISKPISALAVLILVEEGRLDLDSNVNKYLASWKLDENGMTDEKVPSLRLILSHNAGISVHGFAGYKQNEKMPTLDQVLNGEGNSPKIMVNNPPGEHAIYSGGGYTVVQKLIEDITGDSFELFMKKSVLDPLSMENSRFSHPLPQEFHSKASAAYDKEGQLIEGLWHNYPELAAAGLWTTPSDLAKYMIEIMEIRHDKDDGILSRKTIYDMLSLQGGGYHGLGPEVTDSDGTLEFGHLGKNAGFTNDMLGGADSKNAIIIMTNADNGGKIMSEIQRSVCSYYGINLEIPETQIVETTSVSLSYLESLTGKYEFVVPETGERLEQFMELSVQDGKLAVFHESSGDLHLLEPLINNRFLDFGSGLLIEFNPADSTGGFIIEDWEAKLIKLD
jgi:CubicO group peptidase (beta-lactamase class C family)